MVQEQIDLKTHLKNNQSKMDWRCGSSGREPALQALSPSSNPGPTKKINYIKIKLLEV
jgi:hypothetical protein